MACAFTGPTGKVISRSSDRPGTGASRRGGVGTPPDAGDTGGARGTVGPPWHHGGVPAAPVEPTSRLRVVMGEEELLRARAVSAVRAAVLDRHPDVEVHELTAA